MEWANIITKVLIDRHGEGHTYDRIQESLTKLEVDYVELMLQHQPFNDVYGDWRDMERAHSERLICTIGVFTLESHLHDLGSFNLGFIDSKMTFYAGVRTGELEYRSNLLVPMKTPRYIIKPQLTVCVSWGSLCVL